MRGRRAACAGYIRCQTECDAVVPMRRLTRQSAPCLSSPYSLWLRVVDHSAIHHRWQGRQCERTRVRFHAIDRSWPSLRVTLPAQVKDESRCWAARTNLGSRFTESASPRAWSKRSVKIALHSWRARMATRQDLPGVGQENQGAWS